MKIKLTGTPNLGGAVKRTEDFTVTNTEETITIKDHKGNVIVSFNPFFNGGSIWLEHFCSVILDVEKWEDDAKGEYKKVNVENIATSSSEIQRWKEDSEKLAKIREAHLFVLEN